MSSDDDPTTPIHGTGTYPVFRQGAREIAQKLEAFGSVDSYILAERMWEFEALFAKWSPTNRPSEGARSKSISDFLTLHRTCQEYLSKETR